MKVVYIDVLFLLNFIIDYLLVSMTAHLRGNVVKELRLASAAAIGGIAACIVFFLPSGAFISMLAKPLSCCIVVATAFGVKDKKRFIGDCAMLCAASFILSGGVIACAQLFPNIGGQVSNGTVYFDISLKALILGTAACYIIVSFFTRKGSFKQERALRDIRCGIRGGEAAFKAFVDTGNMLTEPIGGRKVILTSASVIAAAVGGLEGQIIKEMRQKRDVTGVFEALAAIDPKRYGLTPYTSAGGRGLIITVKPDNFTIDNTPSDDYVLGISLEEISTAAGCRAVIGY